MDVKRMSSDATSCNRAFVQKNNPQRRLMQRRKHCSTNLIELKKKLYGSLLTTSTFAESDLLHPNIFSAIGILLELINVENDSLSLYLKLSD
jgi:hypothetical protein